MALDRAAAYAWRLLVLAAAFVVAVYVLSRLRIVVLPLILALVLSTFLAPPARWLCAHRVPPALSALIVLVAVGAAMVGIGRYVVPPVVDEMRQLPEQIEAGVEQIEDWLQRAPGPVNDVDDLSESIIDQLRERQDKIVSGALSGAFMLVEIVAGLILTVVVLFFFLKDGAKMFEGSLRIVPEPRRADVRACAKRGYGTLAGFMRGAAIDGLIEAVLVAIALLILGIPLAIPIALITFFAGFLPVVGAFLAGAVAALVALVSGDLRDAIIVVIVFTAIQQLQNNLLEPFILARAVRLPPLVVLLSITAGAAVAGIIGAFLAVPAVAVTVSVVDEARSRAAAGPAPET